MHLLKVNICFILLSANCVFGSRILGIFVVPSYSHQVVFKKLSESLLDRGHELVVASPLKYEKHPNLTHVDLTHAGKIWIDTLNFNKAKQKEASYGEMVDLFGLIVAEITKYELSVPQVQKYIKEKFDLLIVEYGINSAVYYLKHYMNVPMIGVITLDATPFGHYEIGHSYHMYEYAEAHGGAKLPSESDSLEDHIRTIYQRYRIWYMYERVSLPAQGQIVKDLIDPKFKGFEHYDLVPDVLMVNAHPVLGFARPVAPTFVDITGIHVEKPKQLPKNIQQIVDESDGVILFSLGGNVKSEQLPKHIVEAFVEAFSEVPYTVLWKWESEERLQECPENVFMEKWLPQNDVLNNSKTKLFITQGGYQSMIEAITYGVPMIAIPFVGDQYLNADKIRHYEIGLRIHVNEITKNRIREAVVNVITEKRYKENVMKMSKELYDAPMSPSDRAVWWVEYVIRHNGTKHLRYNVRKKLSYLEYFYLDVIFLASAVPIVIFLGVIIACKASKRSPRTFENNKKRN